MSIQEAEVSRVKKKVKSLQSELCEQWDKCNEQEDGLNQAEKVNQQLEHEQQIHTEQIEQYEETVRKQNLEVECLQQHIGALEEKMKENDSQAKASATAIDIFTQKYQASLDAVQGLEKQIQT
ncbi:unnamed protein product [Natator depressus]